MYPGVQNRSNLLELDIWPERKKLGNALVAQLSNAATEKRIEFSSPETAVGFHWQCHPLTSLGCCQQKLSQIRHAALLESTLLSFLDNYFLPSFYVEARPLACGGQGMLLSLLGKYRCTDVSY